MKRTMFLLSMLALTVHSFDLQKRMLPEAGASEAIGASAHAIQRIAEPGSLMVHLSSDLVEHSTSAIANKMPAAVRQHYLAQDESAFNDALSTHAIDAHSRAQFERMFHTRKWLKEHQPRRLSFSTLDGMPDIMPLRTFHAMPPMLQKAYLHLDEDRFVSNLDQLVFRKVVTKETAGRWKNYFEGRRDIYLATSDSMPSSPISHQSNMLTPEVHVARTRATKTKQVSLQSLIESLPTIRTRPPMNRDSNGKFAKSVGQTISPPIRKNLRKIVRKGSHPVSPRHRRKSATPERAPLY